MLNELLKFKNRQTIINEYNDEELIKRWGFFLDEMKMNQNSLVFIKNGIHLLEIGLPAHSSVRKDGSFSNLYTIGWDLIRIEIYFP